MDQTTLPVCKGRWPDEDPLMNVAGLRNGRRRGSTGVAILYSFFNPGRAWRDDSRLASVRRGQQWDFYQCGCLSVLPAAMRIPAQWRNQRWAYDRRIGYRACCLAWNSRNGMLHIENLSAPGLHPVSFSLGTGQCMAVRGPSGAGKTLLLRAISDLDPNSGSVLLGGGDRPTIAAPLLRPR